MACEPIVNINALNFAARISCFENARAVVTVDGGEYGWTLGGAVGAPLT